MINTFENFHFTSTDTHVLSSLIFHLTMPMPFQNNSAHEVNIESTEIRSLTT